MQQKEISRWLKAITIVLALMGAVFFLYIMPVLAMSWRDADESENAKCFRNISHFALLLSVVWFAGIVFLAILAVRQPGISIFMITAVLLSVMISVLAAALSHLVLKAYELKQENELTI